MLVNSVTIYYFVFQATYQFNVVLIRLRIMAGRGGNPALSTPEPGFESGMLNLSCRASVMRFLLPGVVGGRLSAGARIPSSQSCVPGKMIH